MQSKVFTSSTAIQRRVMLWGRKAFLDASGATAQYSAPQIERNTAGNHFLPLFVRGARFGASKLAFRVGLSFCTYSFIKVEDF